MLTRGTSGPSADICILSWMILLRVHWHSSCMHASMGVWDCEGPYVASRPGCVCKSGLQAAKTKGQGHRKLPEPTWMRYSLCAVASAPSATCEDQAT